MKVGKAINYWLIWRHCVKGSAHKVTGEIRVRINASTWRFTWSLRWLNLQVIGLAWVLQVSETWADFWAWARPGLAPELSIWMASPWLTRTAGETVYRPMNWRAFFERMKVDMSAWQRAALALSESFRASTSAFESFGRAMANIKLPKVPGKSNNRKQKVAQ